jgi:choline kinase
MCGGEYEKFQTPKHLSIVKGERLVERTIRLLKENGIEDIAISSNSPLFDGLGVPRLEHNNTYKQINGTQEGYWLDAYYPMQDPVCYLYGDVYYTEQAIKTIIDNKDKGNILFGTSIARNELHQNWGEPFAYKVNDPITFFKGIEAVKKLQDEGKTKRMPVSWELYRYLNGLDVNIQRITNNYIDIDDGTMDIDYPEDIKELNK